MKVQVPEFEPVQLADAQCAMEGDLGNREVTLPIRLCSLFYRSEECDELGQGQRHLLG